MIDSGGNIMFPKHWHRFLFLGSLIRVLVVGGAYRRSSRPVAKKSTQSRHRSAKK